MSRLIYGGPPKKETEKKGGRPLLGYFKILIIGSCMFGKPNGVIILIVKFAKIIN